MAITRDADTDDDGTGTTGTIRNAAWKTQLYDRIDAAIDGADATTRTVAKGGTGATTLTDRGVLIGRGTAAIEAVAPGTLGKFLRSLGASSNPGYGGLFTEQTATETGAQNNYNLTSSCTFLRCTGAAPVFSGFTVAGAAPSTGDVVLIQCLGTTAKVTTQDTNSTAANRIICPSTAGQIVGVNGLMLLVYDDTTDRWREQVIDCGAWITPTFAGGDFTASGSMTWTVESGDISNFSYQQRGNTLTITLYVDTTTVGGTVSNQLRVAIHGGFAGAKASLNQVLYYSDNGTTGVGFVDVADAGTVLRLLKSGGGNWTLATNNTSVYTTVTIEID